MKNRALTTIRGVLFDWDLTLARAVGDMSRNARLAALFQHNGYSCTPEAVQEAAEAFRQDVAKGRLASANYPPQTQVDTTRYYLYVLTHLGYANVTWEEATELYHAYGLLPTLLYDDTLPTLKLLRDWELQMGIVSNHTPYARSKMEELVGEFVRPEHILISEEIGLHKPSAAIFREALRRMGLTAAQCIFVGDNLNVDAISAVQQGGFRHGLWLDRGQSETPLHLPDQVTRITSLSQIVDYLSA